MSIASELNIERQLIENAYDKLDDLGIDITDVDKNIDNIADMLEDVWQEYPKVTGTGTEVTLEGTKAGKIGIDIEGNSTQETTEGKQLFNNDASRVWTSRYNNATKIDTGIKLALTGETNGSNLVSVWKLIDLSNHVGKIVRMKSHITKSGNHDCGYVIGLINSNGSTRVAKTSVGTDNQTISFTVPEFEAGATETYLGVWLYLNRQTTYIQTNGYTEFSNLIVTINNSDMTYELYTGAIPSPNPSYPQPINTAGDNVNLFDKDNAKDTFYYNAQGTTTNAPPNQFINQEISLYNSYTVSYKSKTNGGGLVAYVRFVEYDENNTFIKRTQISSNNTTITPATNTKKIIISVDAGPNAYFEELKIEKGSIATLYTPYGMGCITEKIVNKNWFDKANTSWYRNNSDQFDNQTDTNTTRIRTNSFEIKGGDTYTISGIPNNISLVSIRIFDANKTRITNLNTTTFTLPSNAKYIHLLFGGENFDSSTNTLMANANIQIEQGSTATTYVAHLEQTFIIPTQQPMRKIGDVRDLFFKNVQGSEYYDNTLTENAWYERHNLGYDTYTGANTENWSYYQGLIYIDNTNIKAYSGNASKLLMNYFHYPQCYIGDTSHQRLHINLANAGLSDITTVAGWKTWLSTHNLNFQYELATPTNLPCTSEQTTALEALSKAKGYDNVVHVFSTDVTPANLYVEAMKA